MSPEVLPYKDMPFRLFKCKKLNSDSAERKYKKIRVTSLIQKVFLTTIIKSNKPITKTKGL